MTNTQLVIVFMAGWITHSLWCKVLREARRAQDEYDPFDWEEDNRGYESA